MYLALDTTPFNYPILIVIAAKPGFPQNEGLHDHATSGVLMPCLEFINKERFRLASEVRQPHVPKKRSPR